jgi:trimethylamine---corrinoid protein Co-methyltransferase
MGSLSLQVLSDAEIETIHSKSLDVLEEVGVRILHEGALERLEKAGAIVDNSSGNVRFPRSLVAELLKMAPSTVICGDLKSKKLDVGGKNRYYLSLILDPIIHNYHGGLRKPMLNDVRNHTIIGESLNRINAMMRMQFPVSDISGPDSYLKTMEVFLSHTTKHIFVYPVSTDNCREWLDALDVVCDATNLDEKHDPIATVAVAVTSPLVLHGLNVELMEMAISKNYPIITTVCPMAGTTSPFTMAGTSLVANVEALFPILLAQVYHPGYPVYYAHGPSISDMRSGHDMYYRAEKFLFKLAGIQMAKFYGLPTAGECGGTLTYRPDVQNGAESMAYMMASVTAGQNFICGIGSMHNANGMSAEQIIMQCGLLDMAEYLARGIDFDEQKLGFNSIKEVGPGGNFLADELTIAMLRGNEFFTSENLDMSGGYTASDGIYEMAHNRAVELVEKYKPTVPEKVRIAIKNHFRSKYSDKNISDI